MSGVARVSIAAVLRLGEAGLTWREVGAALAIPPSSACRYWRSFAAPAQHARRAAMTVSQTYRRRPQELAALIARGRRGDTWRLIGADLYPEREPQQSADTAQLMFSRHASKADKAARRDAMRQNNANRTPGLSPAADRRRRKKGRWGGVPENARPEFARPWVGQGNVFA